MAAACWVEPALSEAARRAAVAVERYAPVSVSATAAAFTREVVARAAPATPGRAKALLFAGSRLAGFAERVGLELEPRVVLCEATVERFILVGCAGVSPATRRTLRTNLRALARALERYPQPAAVALVRERNQGSRHQRPLPRLVPNHRPDRHRAVHRDDPDRPQPPHPRRVHRPRGRKRATSRQRTLTQAPQTPPHHHQRSHRPDRPALNPAAHRRERAEAARQPGDDPPTATPRPRRKTITQHDQKAVSRTPTAPPVFRPPQT